MLREPEAGLPHPRVEAYVADELLGAGEPAHVADRSDQAGSDHKVHTGNGQQSLDRWVVDGSLCDVSVEHVEVFAEPIELAQMPRDRGPLIVRQRLSPEPVPARSSKQVMRAA
jgi:hypothetical protein